jgi:SAM-dependent methyltransferase
MRPSPAVRATFVVMLPASRTLVVLSLFAFVGCARQDPLPSPGGAGQALTKDAAPSADAQDPPEASVAVENEDVEPSADEQALAIVMEDDDASAPRWKRVPDVIYVPTPQPVVDKMLEMAKVTKKDVVYDLGCGDGRIPVTAAKRYGAKALGVDLDPDRIDQAMENVRTNDVGHLVTIEEGDVFDLDLRPASVVTIYLLPELNVKLLPQLRKLKPGSRVVTHDFDIEGVEPIDHYTWKADDPDAEEHYVFLYEAPL